MVPPCVQVTNFYDYAGEGEEGEEDMEKWILQQPNRGAIRWGTNNFSPP